ncbi:hypothetical protein F53441_1095 [Fusarium austroafricanum]|uniref:Uncharacterized protein n=1 Tax=Fusarium austroafricanum TaxID=2364996 RepID=A0A8H4NZF5_9HYPO|nr:hypothetical protein F53441_1095 [Fusarium austroafricanum]
MEDPKPTTTQPATITRTAYIRTIIDRDRQHEYYESNWADISWLINAWVGQKVSSNYYSTPRRLHSEPPPGLRHHYILGYSNPVDVYILDWFLRRVHEGSEFLSLGDFEVFLSEAQIKDPANKDLLQRLQKEGVHVQVVKISTPVDYETDDRCDAVMLTESDYVIETSLLRRSCQTLDVLYKDSLRHGHPQRYNTKELSNQYYKSRLTNKMGHTQKECMFPHGKSEGWKHNHMQAWINYACPSCGKRCKRSKGCKTTGEDWAKDERATAWSEGVDLSAPRPPEFERDWRMLTAEDVCAYYGRDPMASQRFRKWKWRSIDTFSGE